MAIEITIKETRPDGSSTFTTRWAHPNQKGEWSSASNLGKDHLDHRDEAAARVSIAGWLRSQATKLEEVPPPPKPAPVAEPEPTAAGLEDLL